MEAANAEMQRHAQEVDEQCRALEAQAADFHGRWRATAAENECLQCELAQLRAALAVRASQLVCCIWALAGSRVRCRSAVPSCTGVLCAALAYVAGVGLTNAGRKVHCHCCMLSAETVGLTRRRDCGERRSASSRAHKARRPSPRSGRQQRAHRARRCSTRCFLWSRWRCRWAACWRLRQFEAVLV